MAQLKDSLIAGDLRVTGTIYGDGSGVTNLNTDNISTGILPVAHGGTGQSNFTAGTVLIGNGGGAIQTRAITNLTAAGDITSNTNLITANTLNFWKGTSNIVKVGTITSGTWNGSTVAVAYGGTSRNTLTANAIIAGNGTNAVNMIATADGALFATAAGGAATFGTLPVPQGGTGQVSFTKNAVLYGNDSGALQAKASADGALYAEDAGGTLKWGTLPVAQGGTGNAEFTVNSVIMSGATKTGALVTRAVTNNTTNTAITNSNTNIPTMNTIYYGLTVINNASQSRANTIYAPTGAGTKNQILVSSGGTSAPTWLATGVGAAYATATNGQLTFGTLPIAQGGTGATSAAAARTNLGVGNGKVFYGECTTAAATTAKVVTCADFTSSNLVAGALIFVRFTVTNTGAVGSLTMNVNSTGAKPLKQMINSATSNLSSAGELYANAVIPFFYDGTNWVANSNYNTTYSSMTQAEANAGTSTSSRVITPKVLNDTITSKIVNSLIYEDITLAASGWSNGVYRVSSNNVSVDSVQIVFLPDQTLASSDEMDALGAAKIVDAGQGDGYFDLKCLGDVPTINIDIRVLYNYSTTSALSSMTSAAASANAAATSAAQAAASAKVQRKTVTFSSVTSDTSVSPYKYKYEVTWTGVTANDWVDGSGITDQDWAIESATNKVILRFTNNITSSKTVTCYWATTEAS